MDIHTHSQTVATQIRQSYDVCASKYDEIVQAKNSSNSVAEAPFMHKLIGVVSGQRILDLSCGTGRYTIWLRKAGASVVGLDFSKRSIDVAKWESREENLDIKLLVADVNALPIGKGCDFDGIVCGMGVHYWSDLRKAFSQFPSILKPRGWFIFSTDHPVVEAGSPITDEKGNQGRTVFRYFDKSLREYTWKDIYMEDGTPCKVVYHSYNFQDITCALADSGFLIEQILEPVPVQHEDIPSELHNRLGCSPRFALFRALRR